ncbi:MAG TPA: cytosine permease [Terriglobia bacterium]|nr:cytosine permease [Terriglobia bacterium]
MAQQLPGYIQSNVPNPLENRAPWYKNTAPTYAGIFLWFVFWNQIATLGLRDAGLGICMVALLVSALICHYLFYLVPGLLGMKTGRPLYIVGTSTFGAVGGFLMPGFLMGLLQFGWLGVNTFFASTFIVEVFSHKVTTFPDFTLAVVCILWGLGAAFVGLKGIQYVARVATYLPLIPLAVLFIMLFKTGLAAGGYQPVVDNPAAAHAKAWLATISYVVGFFATAGAAGVDFGLNSRNARDVKRGGLVGIALAIVVSAGIPLLVVAGAHSMRIPGVTSFAFTDVMNVVLGSQLGGFFMLALTIASFPPACFSSFIAANSFKTTLPKVNPFVSVGLGAIFSIVIAVFGWAGNLGAMFGLIGASFGPICGAMVADYFMSKMSWPGPRADFNIPGWIAWLAGFVVGILPNEALTRWGVTSTGQFSFLEPAPVIAFVVGGVIYFILAKLGLQSRSIPLGQTKE